MRLFRIVPRSFSSDSMRNRRSLFSPMARCACRCMSMSWLRSDSLERPSSERGVARPLIRVRVADSTLLDDPCSESTSVNRLVLRFFCFISSSFMRQFNRSVSLLSASCLDGSPIFYHESHLLHQLHHEAVVVLELPHPHLITPLHILGTPFSLHDMDITHAIVQIVASQGRTCVLRRRSS